jgi:uncharacterized protein YcbK (DUF882 family)
MLPKVLGMIQAYRPSITTTFIPRGAMPIPNTKAADNDTLISRRQCLLGLGGLIAGTVALASSNALAYAPNMKQIKLPSVRSLSFVNLHTGERAKKITYFEYGNYVPDALEEINHVLRDHRNNEVHAMDPKLMDALSLLHKKLGSSAEYKVISGYRSPDSNAKLAAKSGGVAKKSMHMQGKAIDIVLADRKLSEIRDAAKSLNIGGVGYYAGQFVHVDTGRVRSW